MDYDTDFNTIIEKRHYSDLGRSRLESLSTSLTDFAEYRGEVQ